MSKELRELVFKNLSSAFIGIYEVRTWSAKGIAADLVARSPGLHNQLPDDLLPHVEAWLAEQQKIRRIIFILISSVALGLAVVVALACWAIWA
jgi:type VI protein secretion system component VasF